MHTLKILLAGFALLGLFLLAGRFLGGSAAKMGTAALWFIPVWLLVSIGNLWVGVSKAGYTVAQELPILLFVFGIPTLAAAIISWKLNRG